MSAAIMGFRQTIEEAESVLDQLYEGGFASSEISVLMPDGRETRACTSIGFATAES